ncbi:hypothetical protein [Flavobacterium terrae]|uniref:YD repeat-containing protein n=1 Tax=Flavobacterium terrae TaxID=415425 RepID=A0A1M6HDV3_9FLAO|nr:hypothetical protein [Flavobacterium terrae]SHJ20397.1 hypothetical protein SAMN05444363_2992 [Flavobacterium terrae]
MKTIKNILFLTFLMLLTSCSDKDDYNPQGYFPTTIEFTDYTNSVNDKTVTISYNSNNTISYNSNNTISQIVLNDNNGTKTKQYTYTNGRITSVTNSGFLGGPDVRTFVYNSNGILSSIVDDTGGTIENYPINYNATTNTYSLVDGGDTSSVQLDNSNNPIIYSSTLFASDLEITLDGTQKGVFEHVTPQIALQFDLALFNNGHLFYFFNQKQINNFQFGVQDIDIVNNRDTNGNITSVIYNFTGGGSQLDITYQNRNL